MACRLLEAKPLPEPLLYYCQLDPWEQTNLNQNTKLFTWSLRNGSHFFQGGGLKETVYGICQYTEIIILLFACRIWYVLHMRIDPFLQAWFNCDYDLDR